VTGGRAVGKGVGVSVDVMFLIIRPSSLEIFYGILDRVQITNLTLPITRISFSFWSGSSGNK
jgi:hypothetical protein